MIVNIPQPVTTAVVPVTAACHRRTLWVDGRAVLVCTHQEHWWQPAPLRGAR